MALENEIDGAPEPEAVIKDDAGASVDAATPAIADPSAATDSKQPAEGALSVVRDVVAARKPADPAAAASSATGEVVGAVPDAKAPKEPDNVNFSDVPFNKHPRFREVIDKLKTAEAGAKQFDNVTRFLDDNGLAANEAAELLQVGALAKTDPAKAWERAKPWVQNLLIAAGEVLPQELQQRVAAGEMTREVAIDLSRSRAQNASHEVSRTVAEQRAEKARETEVNTSRTTAASEWEADRRVKDPNYAAKEGPLTREIAYLQMVEGKPKDAAGVKDMLKRAYEAVNKQFVPPAAPKPARRATVPVVGGQVAANAVSEAPRSTLDIVRAQLGKRA